MSHRIGQTASSSAPRNTSFFPGSAFDVFLSFRGEDTRYTFTDHLYTALVKKGIHTFRDDEELERGERIDQNLQQAIEESRIFIIIFSENYANSKWCLNELVKIMECRARGRKVFPIFYHVNPSEVRRQSGKYGTAFAVYENDANLEEEQIQKWRTALTDAGNLAGCHIENQYEAQMIQEITERMIREIIGKHCNEDGLVGKKRHLEALKELISKPKDVLMVGIYGVGGIGKTTIARALYEEISSQFKGASFLANIGEVSKKDGLYCLQERLFCDILFGGENQEIRFHRRSNLMKDKIGCKEVLIILDDVNDAKQLQTLAGKHDWFGKGSRIVITTKNRHLLVNHNVDESYELKELEPREALELFSHHANTKEKLGYDFYPLSTQVIRYCEYHPLALQVVGAFLRCKNYYGQWQVLLDNLARESAIKKFNILRVSYNALDLPEQYIFLDVVCFFNGEYEDFVKKMLDGQHIVTKRPGECKFSAEDGLKVLTDRCLITVSERKIWMHSEIQNLGWEIVREAAKRSRLCDHMDVQRLLRTEKGIREVEGISLDLSKSNQIHFSTEVFAKMTELKLLKVFLGPDCVNTKENCIVNLFADFRLPGTLLRYLHWHGYQLKFCPSNFRPMELLELSMPYSCLKQINGSEIHFSKLTILNLSHSQHLENISNFFSMPNLERLVLEGCGSLIEVDKSIGVLVKLSLMNLKDCNRLNSLPENIFQLKCLETLILVGCSGLEELPDGLEGQQSLLNLKANGTSIRGITPPPNLRILHLGNCKRLQKIPELPSSIQEADAYGCSFEATLDWNTVLGASILQRIKIAKSEFSILLPGNAIPDCCFPHKVKGSSVTMKMPNRNWYNNEFLGFAVCLVFAPKAEKPQLNPEILCELNNFTFFYSCGEDSGQGNNTRDHVWLAYRPRSRADRCRPKEWNHIRASFEVLDCEVKESAICLIYKSKSGRLRARFEHSWALMGIEP